MGPLHRWGLVDFWHNLDIPWDQEHFGSKFSKMRPVGIQWGKFQQGLQEISLYPLNPLFLKFFLDSFFIVKQSPSLDHYLCWTKSLSWALAYWPILLATLIFLAHQILMQTIYKALAIGLSLGVRKKPMWLMRLLEWECWIVYRITLFTKLALKCWNSFISLHIGLERKKLWP